MIVAEQTTEITGNLVFAEQVPMGVDPAVVAIILRTLTNLYASPHIACLREYSANALDSHVEAKQTRPVEISLPNLLSPNLVIEDWGIGMSREGLKSYGQYGESSKTKTNEQIGGMGLGSKSGLSISPQFTVRAVKDGKKNTVVIGYDENSAPTMKMFAEVDTDEPNGVQVTIPTNETDKFHEALARNFFLGWAPGSVLIDGKAPETSVHTLEQFTPIGNYGWAAVTSDTPNSHISDPGWIRAVVGPVGYKIKYTDIHPVNYSLQSGYLRDVVLNLPIGSVDLTPSRESLRYTGRTKEAIQKALEGIVNQAVKLYQEQIDGASTLREALLVARRATKYGFPTEYTFLGASLSLKNHPFTGKIDDNVAFAGINPWASRPGVSAYKKNISTQNLAYSQDILNSTLLKETAILVPDAGEFSQNKSNKSQPALAKYTQNYLIAESEKTGSTVALDSRTTVMFTSLQAKELDPVLRAAFTSEVSAEAFFNQAETYRKDKAAADRAARKLEAPTKKVEECEVKILRVGNKGAGWHQEEQLSDLDTTKKYILLRNDPAQPNREHQALRIITSQVGYQENRGLGEILEYIYKQGYVFIKLYKNEKTDLITAALPNIVTIPEALDEILTVLAPQMTPHVVQAAFDSTSYKFGWVALLKPYHIDEVNNKKTKEWLLAMTDGATKKRLSFFQNILEKGARAGLDLSKHKLNVTASDSPGARYPMLENASYIRNTNEIPKYLNQVDYLADHNITI